MKRRLFVGALGATVGIGAFAAGGTGLRRPKYIFLCIGDGLGIAQREMAERFARLKYPHQFQGLRINHLPVQGTCTTLDANGKITDSAAAATALACGQKAVSYTMGVAPDKTTPLRSVIDDAHDAGMKVGLVTDVSIDHSTPAPFFSHVPSRTMYYEIDRQMADSDIQYLAGETMLGRSVAKGNTPPRIN